MNGDHPTIKELIDYELFCGMKAVETKIKEIDAIFDQIIEFAELKEAGYQMGLDYVESGPLVRSSYHSERHVLPGYGRKAWSMNR